MGWEGNQRGTQSAAELLAKMQRKMTGLDNKQMKVIKEYESELDAMKSEIKKIRTDYDGLRHKNHKYRHQLKDKTEQLKKIHEDQSRLSQRGAGTTDVWTSEKAKLLSKLKQIEIEKRQVDEERKSLMNIKE